MDHPKAPEIRRRKVSVRPGKHTYGIECRNRKRGEKEQPRHISHMVRAQPASQTAKQNEHPEDQTNRQQNLPEAAQIKILETLAAEPGPTPLNPAVNPGIFAGQTSENDDRQRDQEDIGKPVLSPGLSSRNHR